MHESIEPLIFERVLFRNSRWCFWFLPDQTRSLQEGMKLTG